MNGLCLEGRAAAAQRKTRRHVLNQSNAGEREFGEGQAGVVRERQYSVGSVVEGYKKDGTDWLVIAPMALMK